MLTIDAQWPAVNESRNDPAVVGPWVVDDLCLDLTVDAGDAAKYLVVRSQPETLVLFRCNRHQIQEADTAGRRMKGRFQNCCVLQVAPFRIERSRRANGEAPTVLGIEKRSKHGGAVEAWPTHPVQGPSLRYECRGTTIPYDSVAFDWWVD